MPESTLESIFRSESTLGSISVSEGHSRIDPGIDFCTRKPNLNKPWDWFSYKETISELNQQG